VIRPSGAVGAAQDIEKRRRAFPSAFFIAVRNRFGFISKSGGIPAIRIASNLELRNIPLKYLTLLQRSGIPRDTTVKGIYFSFFATDILPSP
jgi:hypothetical protein